MSEGKRKLVVEMSDGEANTHTSDGGLRFEVKDGCLIVEKFLGESPFGASYRQVAAYSAHAWKSVYRDDEGTDT